LMNIILFKLEMLINELIQTTDMILSNSNNKEIIP